MLDTCRVQLYNTSSSAQLNIIAPTGSFGNHVRTLLLLDPKYSFTIAPHAEDYNIFAGTDWPDYDTYSRVGVPNTTEDNIKQEIRNLCLEHDFLNFSCQDSILSKTNFIFKELYTPWRSWHNWIWAERRWRVHLDQLISLVHSIPETLADEKYIIVTGDPKLAYRSYLKFNSNLNVLPVEQFLILNTQFNQQARSITKENVLVISSDSLFAETLDYDLYTQIVNWLDYDNLYANANLVHRDWYNLHKKAERELVDFFTNFYI